MNSAFALPQSTYLLLEKEILEKKRLKEDERFWLNTYIVMILLIMVFVLYLIFCV